MGGCLVILAAACSPLAAQNPSGSADGVMVRNVSFKGNHALDDETLAMSIATSRSSWARRWPIIRALGLGEKRVFDEVEFRRDVLRLQLLYRLSGFYDARVDTTVERRPDYVNVTFRIIEGPPILVDSITIVRNDRVMTPKRIYSRLPLKVHDPLNRYLFDLSADTLLFTLRERGFPFAQVFRNYSVNHPTLRSEVEYDVETGPRSTIGEIDVDSAAGVDRALVRRFLPMRPGDLYKQSALFQAQRTLYQTDMFRYVAVGIAADSTVHGSDSLVRVRVSAVPGPRASARIGAGYGTSDCFRTQATSTFANFAGGGRRLDLVGQLSKIGVGTPTPWGLENSLCPSLRDDPFSDTLNYSVSATLFQPALFTRHTSGSLGLFAERHSEFRAYENVNVGTAVTFNFGNGIPPGAALTYRIAQSRTDASPAIFCTNFDRCDATVVDVLERTKTEGSLTLALADINTNIPVDPTIGHALTLDLTEAARPLYSQVVFSKAVGEATWYHPLTKRSVLALRFRGGAIRTGQGEVGGTPIRFVPPEERFYMGGPTTVRGFGRNAMGPVVYVADTSTDVTVAADSSVTACRNCRVSALGGSAVLLGNVELRTPSPIWPARLRWVFFVDAGELWEQLDSRPTGLLITPGMGIRFATPLGPMRFDVGYDPYKPECGPVYAVNGTALDRVGKGELCPALRSGLIHRLQFQFSVGQAY